MAVATSELAIKIRLKDFTPTGFTKLQARIKKFQRKTIKSFRRMQKAVLSVRNGIMSLAVAWGGLRLAKSIIKAGTAAENFKIQLAAVMDNNKFLAEQTLEWVRKFGAETPHTTEDVVQSFIRMKAVGIDVSKKMMTTIGNAAFVMNRNINDVAMATIAPHKKVLQRMGIALDRMGATAVLTSGNIRVETEKDAASIRRGILQIWEQRFPNAMKSAKKSFRGMMALMQSEWWELKVQLAEGGAMDALKVGMKAVTEEIVGASKGLKKFGEGSDDVFDGVIDGIKAAAWAVHWFKKIILGTEITFKTMQMFGQMAAFGVGAAYEQLALKMEETNKDIESKIKLTIATITHLLPPIKQIEEQMRMAGKGTTADILAALRFFGESAGIIAEGTAKAAGKVAKTAGDQAKDSGEVLAKLHANITLTKAQIKKLADEVDMGTMSYEAFIAKINLYSRKTKEAAKETADMKAKLKAAADVLNALGQGFLMVEPEKLETVNIELAKALRILDAIDVKSKNVNKNVLSLGDILEGVGDFMVSSLVAVFDNLITKTRTMNQLIQDLLRSLASSLLQTGLDIVKDLAIAGIKGAIGGSAKGNVFGSGNIKSFANGGTVYGPQLSMIGDNPTGHEGVLPLERGADGKLGVIAQGGGGGGEVHFHNTVQVIDSPGGFARILSNPSNQSALTGFLAQQRAMNPRSMGG